MQIPAVGPIPYWSARNLYWVKYAPGFAKN